MIKSDAGGAVRICFRLLSAEPSTTITEAHVGAHTLASSAHLNFIELVVTTRASYIPRSALRRASSALSACTVLPVLMSSPRIEFADQSQLAPVFWKS